METVLLPTLPIVESWEGWGHSSAKKTEWDGSQKPQGGQGGAVSLPPLRSSQLPLSWGDRASDRSLVPALHFQMILPNSLRLIWALLGAIGLNLSSLMPSASTKLHSPSRAQLGGPAGHNWSSVSLPPPALEFSPWSFCHPQAAQGLFQTRGGALVAEDKGAVMFKIWPSEGLPRQHQLSKGAQRFPPPFIWLFQRRPRENFSP